MFGDQLDGVPGPISRIRDRSATRTTITRGTTVADRRLHARLELQLIPELARISLETWVSAYSYPLTGATGAVRVPTAHAHGAHAGHAGRGTPSGVERRPRRERLQIRDLRQGENTCRVLSPEAS